jgi:hypothetical protein
VTYLDKALFPGLTVQQVLDVRGLGYDYASAAVAVGDDVPEGMGASAGDVPEQTGGDAPTPEPEPPTTAPSWTSPPLDVGSLDPQPNRGDIEFHHVDHAGASYEGRVYLNNPDANADTGTDDPTYAGRYYIFGHGGCLGDPGHCDVKPRRLYDPRPAHPLTKAKKVVRATDAVTKAIAAGGEVTVTVVPIVEPIPYDNVDSKHTDDPLDIGYVKIVTYR